jgi:farnesyl diphosphate synthase
MTASQQSLDRSTTTPATAVMADGKAFEQWMAEKARRTEQALASRLPQTDGALARLHEAMRYAVLGGGKRIRPLLLHAAGELVGAPLAALDAAACAVELIHAYSLVHDDMPCMDNDVLRRGKPTVHVAYGEAMAMLVGDALQALAFEALADAIEHADRPDQAARLLRDLSQAAGSLGMAGGQAIDLQAVGHSLSREALEDMHRRKTGAMLIASVRLGAACGAPLPVGPAAALERFAAAVGLAFQVVDDILDVTADSATLGKTAGKDSEQNKPTYVSVMGMMATRALAGSLQSEADTALAVLGPPARRLREISNLIVQRTS